MSFETISVIGLGYIGLPTAAMFASRKKKVIGVDVNQHAVDTINKGKIHIVEPDLDMIVSAAVTEGFLKASTTIEPADAFLIAVPTPFLPCNEGEIPKPDLSYIEAASKAIAPVLKKGDLVILESTSPVGTTEQMAAWLSEARLDLTFPQTHGDYADVNVAHCPERVLPGQVVRELVENDRVIGGLSNRCSARSVELYKTFVLGECVVTNARTAEMAKLAENSSRDLQIAFANELSIICDEVGIDVWELISLANRHPRVNILQPGIGVGGHCIAVDPWFIISKTPAAAKIIHTARLVNLEKTAWVIANVENALKSLILLGDGKSKIKVGCYGLSFKPNIDDLRESPALFIAKELMKNSNIIVYGIEPNIDDIEKHGVHPINLEDAGKLCDVHLFLVGHDQFKDFKESKGLVLDFCGILN